MEQAEKASRATVYVGGPGMEIQSREVEVVEVSESAHSKYVADLNMRRRKGSLDWHPV